MGRKSSQTIMKSKQVATDKKPMNVRNELIKKQQIVMNQLAKGIRLNKVFKLVLRLSKAIAEIA